MRLLLALLCALCATTGIACTASEQPFQEDAATPDDEDPDESDKGGTKGDGDGGDDTPNDDGGMVGTAAVDDPGPPMPDAGAMDPAGPTGNPAVVVVGSWGFRASLSSWAGLGDWRFCGNQQTSNDHSPDLLRSVSYGDGVFVAVGGDTNSMVMRSLNGVRWEEDLHPENSCESEVFPASCKNWMGGVAYGAGVWLAGGGNGALMRSDDQAATWTAVRSRERLPPIRSLRYGDGRFVAAADGGAVLITADEGQTWRIEKLWTSTFGELVYGEGVFIARGQAWIGGAWQQACFVGRDQAQVWSECPEKLADATTFAHDGERWVALRRGGYLTSTDAAQWTEHEAPDMPQDLTALLPVVGGGYYARRGSTVLHSLDLVEWEVVPGNFSGVRSWTRGLVYDPGFALPEITSDLCVDLR